MKTNIRLGRIFGIEIGLHYSWVFVAVLMVFSLLGYFESSHPDWSGNVKVALAILTALFFFAALVAHELSHALVARSRKLPVRSITLFALGGLAQIEKGSSDARTEFWMAIVGPIASAIIGGLCLLGATAAGWAPGGQADTPFQAMLIWLGYINLGLAVFNMIPGFPMDGGRVLRSIIWWKTGDADRSTRIAARVGQVNGALFIAWGVFRFSMGAGFSGLWVAFIGWFLMRLAGESYQESSLRNAIRGVRVEDVMARDCVSVNGHEDLQSFVNDQLAHSNKQCFVVEENGEPAGLVSTAEVTQVERAKWPFTTLEDVMQPIEEATVSPEMPLLQALEFMAQHHVNQLAVMSNKHLTGILTRFEIAQLFRRKLELEG